MKRRDFIRTVIVGGAGVAGSVSTSVTAPLIVNEIILVTVDYLAVQNASRINVSTPQAANGQSRPG